MNTDVLIIIFLIVCIIAAIIIYSYNSNPKPPSNPDNSNKYIPPGPSPKSLKYNTNTKENKTKEIKTEEIKTKEIKTKENKSKVNNKNDKRMIEQISSNFTEDNTRSELYCSSTGLDPSSTSLINKCDHAKKQWLEHLERHEKEKNDSMGEKLTRRALEQIYGKKFPNVRPDWLINPKTGYRLELDGYCEELKIAFEYHGVQHREWPNKFFKTYEEFERQVERDICKAEQCEKRGIYLIITDFTIPNHEIFEAVKKMTPEYIAKHKK